jgi:DNA invertase Pin-like site-specific DNA recombinase
MARRMNMAEAVKAGHTRAVSRGSKLGRKRKLDADTIRVIAKRYAKGESMADLGRVFGISHTTISRRLSARAARKLAKPARRKFPQVQLPLPLV